VSNDPVVNQVASLNDIVEVVAEYLTLKKSGRNLKACCPFHHEKTPSMMVNPERQIFHCFGCHVGGDVFSFVMKIENLNFPETLQKLANRANFTLPEKSGFRGGNSSSKKEKFYEISELACDFYQKKFQHNSLGKKARDYLLNRGFSTQVIDTYRVGYASEEWQELYNYLRKKGFSEELLLSSGLIRKSQKGRSFDLFRKRVIFPILNAQGRVVAFGGRVLDEADSPKYLNSPESEIFQKRSVFYGLDLAKKNINPNNGNLIVVEGYLDVMRLAQEGVGNSIATLGTALTKEHCHLLKRYVPEVVLVYDGDAAGEAASIRGIDVLIEEEMNAKFLSLPGGEDPDDFLKAHGKGAFDECLNKAQDIFDFKLAYLLKKYNPSESTGLVQITNDFLEMFLKIKNSVLVDRYLNRLSGELRIDENSLRTEIQKLKSKTKRAPRYEEPRSEPEVEVTAEFIGYEWNLLSLSFQRDELLAQLIQQVQPIDFKDAEARNVYEYLKSQYLNEEEEKNVNAFLSYVSVNEKRSKITEQLFLELDEEDSQKAFDDCLTNLKKKYVEEKMQDLMNKIRDAEKQKDRDKVSMYMKSYQDLLNEKKAKFSSAN